MTKDLSSKNKLNLVDTILISGDNISYIDTFLKQIHITWVVWVIHPTLLFTYRDCGLYRWT